MKVDEIVVEVVLRGKDISFKYGNSVVLEKCNIEINAGDFSVIIGANGSGKSTLLKICLGLMVPQGGKVELFGIPISEFNQWEKIGYVSQRIDAFNKGFPATVEEVVKAPLYAKSAPFKRNRKEMDKLSDNALNTVGMEGFNNRLIGKLSVGQQQRVFIAKALVNNPEILFMDEPTAGIDNKTEKEFYALLKELNKDNGITIIMVTHDYTDVKPMVNKVFCLNDGTITEKCSDMPV